MAFTPKYKNQTVESSVISKEFLSLASADDSRLIPQVKAWRNDPEAFIRKNFAALQTYDFPLYAYGNIKIQTKKGGSAPFKFNRVQKQLWSWFLEDMASGKPVRWYIIKARQMGVSTWVISLFYWLASQTANRNCLVVTQDETSANNFQGRIRGIYSNSHEYLKSPLVQDSKRIIHFGNKTRDRHKGSGPGLDSRLIFESAKSGELGRSYNFHAVLMSEFAIWPELAIDIEEQLTALNQTVDDSPGTIIIIESTAKGQNAATRMYEDKNNGYRKIFIPWVAFDEYRLPLKEGQELGNLCREDETNGKPTRYGNEVSEKRYIDSSLRLWYSKEVEKFGVEWLREETEARLNWRRNTIDTKCLGNVNKFRQEYPTIASHAFTSSSTQVFDAASIEAMRDHIAEEDLKPARYIYAHDSNVTDRNKKFQLSPFGQLRVYKRPEPGVHYVIAGDPGMGVENTGDPSALIVLKCPDLEEVACFNEIITPDKFAELANYLGLLYNNALLAIENNERGGYAANLALTKNLHYPRLYHRFDHFDKKSASKPGFVTSGSNKAVLVSEVQKAIRDREILLRTDALIEQLEHYMVKSDGTLGCPSPWHDDLVSALLIAVFLSTKVHLYAQTGTGIPKGTLAYFMQRHEESRKPGMFDRRRR
jgi:hypothetical protein